jgi:hypothetical protein
VVAGSLLFGAPDVLARIAWLHSLYEPTAGPGNNQS